MPEDNGKKTESKILKALRLLAKIDWKSMMLILTALGGAGGAVWNKVEAALQEVRTERVQEGTYEILAGRIDELFERVEQCEATAKELPQRAKVKTKASPLRVGRQMAMPKMAPAIANEQAKAITTSAPIELEPIEKPEAEKVESKEFEKARLPRFQIIKQKAGKAYGDLQQFITDTQEN